jgi:hypothetical protein
MSNIQGYGEYMQVQVEIIQYKHVHSIPRGQLPDQARSPDLVKCSLDLVKCSPDLVIWNLNLSMP